MSAQATKCPAADVEKLVADWGDWEVLVPDALTDPGPPPEFEPVWMGVEAVYRSDGDVVFVIVGEDSVRWSVPADREVEVRED